MRLYECTNVRTVSIDLSRYVHMYSLLTMPVSPQNPMINDRSHFNIRIAKCFFFVISGTNLHVRRQNSMILT